MNSRSAENKKNIWKKIFFRIKIETMSFNSDHNSLAVIMHAAQNGTLDQIVFNAYKSKVNSQSNNIPFVNYDLNQMQLNDGSHTGSQAYATRSVCGNGSLDSVYPDQASSEFDASSGGIYDGMRMISQGGFGNNSSGGQDVGTAYVPGNFGRRYISTGSVTGDTYGGPADFGYGGTGTVMTSSYKDGGFMGAESGSGLQGGAVYGSGGSGSADGVPVDVENVIRQVTGGNTIENNCQFRAVVNQLTQRGYSFKNASALVQQYRTGLNQNGRSEKSFDTDWLFRF